MDLLTDIRRPIERELRDYQGKKLATMRRGNPQLGTALRHLQQRQDSRKRPISTLLSARHATGRVNDNVLHAAVALELLHTASLVHDDVVDESDRRRGQRSVNALLGNKVAILVGDFLFSQALRHANFAGSALVMEWLSELGQTLADGELRQLANTGEEEISEQSYYEVIEKKTASLFSACARMGAHLAGGDDEEVGRMADFGRCVGICFQLRDDIFDYDTANSTGKPTGNDMKEGKLTLPVLHAVLSGAGEYRALALRVRQGKATDGEIASLVSLAKERGGIDHTVEAMREYSRRALALLSDGADPAAAEALRRYADFAASRSL